MLAVFQYSSAPIISDASIIKHAKTLKLIFFKKKLIPTKLQSLLDEFKDLGDPGLAADLLIEYADQFKSVPENIAAKPYPEINRVPGCESEAFIWAIPNEDNTSKILLCG